MSLKKSFNSDNNAGIHQEVLNWLIKVNHGHAPAYGNDMYTAQAEKIFKQQFGQHCEPFFILTGTGANVLGLSQVLRSTEAVICADTAHINEHECGAVQNFSGSRLISLPTTDGKLTKELVRLALHGIGDEHYSQPKIISITQATECGTLYSIDELAILSNYAKQNNLLIHMDGARISNAAAALNATFKEFTTDVGIDIVSFGGTKNGLMSAEALLFLNPVLADKFSYLRKQGMQLASKMRFISAQFIAFFENELWKANALHANKMTELMYVELQKFPIINIMYKPEINIIFAQIPENVIHKLQNEFQFYIKDPVNNIARFVCSFDTTETEIHLFIQALKRIFDSTKN